MKSSVNKCGLPSAPVPPSSLSHIPLPRRKSSNKSDKNVDMDDTDSEMSAECVRSTAKMSLLGSTSFCCASGQKEDYAPSDFVPLRPPKKISIVKKESSSPLQGRTFFSRSKRDKVVAEKSSGPQQLVEVEFSKSSPKDNKSKPVSNALDNKLRMQTDKKKGSLPSPQRRPNSKDHSDVRKISDVGVKPLKDNEIPESNGKNQKHIAQIPHPGSLCSSKPSVDNKPPLCPKPDSGNCSKNVLLKSHANFVRHIAKESSMETKNVTFKKSCDDTSTTRQGDDLDCPCCDSVPMDEDIQDDVGIKVFTSCDVVSSHQILQQKNPDKILDDHCDKERTLQLEVNSLKEDLEDGKQKLRHQQDRVQHLEEELMIMQQMKEELEKEKELRKIAEDKLLELLDHEKRMDILKRDNEKRMESKAIQIDPSEIYQSIATTTSPLLSGYEGRLRKYQTYIAKLEKDNLMLLNELKKFKDMSPRSQEEQARVLVDKLGQMERNNQHQQMQYESCLDEVANKLVQTLLVQKRLEEECKVLHLRVEQLEHENRTLSELIDSNKKVEKITEMKEENIDLSPSIVQNRIPSHQPMTSSPIKRTLTSPKSPILSEDKVKEASKTTGTVKCSYQEFRNSVTSPVSPGAKSSCSSKIPSFSTTKPFMYRKKNETELPKPKGGREALPTAQIVSPKPSVLPSAKSKLPNSKGVKGSCVKRKRPSRTGSPADKDSKQRLKSNHTRWETHKLTSESLNSFYMDSDISLSPIQVLPTQQQVWSFNCEVLNNVSVPEVASKVNHSIDVLSSKLDSTADFSEDFNGKQNSSASETSTTMDGANRTRDEGYSTMSSDLQQDSTADTTISEPEHSSTFVISEKSFGSDDSVTECMDSSMCSSSDSGFGPLNQVAISNAAADLHTEQDPNKIFEKLPKQESCRKNGTVRSKEQIASVKPTVRIVSSNCPQPVKKDSSVGQTNATCGGCIRPDSILIPQLTLSDSSTSPIKTSTKDCDTLFLPISSDTEQLKCNINHPTMIDCLDFPKDVLGQSYRNSWHLGSSNSVLDEKIIFCTRHSYIDDNLFDEKVQTAEKSTLTEPEEELWREKALAPFIDESIWSLYSSEGDIQIKHFPLEPLLSEPSLEQLIASCTPCVIVSEDIKVSPQVESREVFKPPLNKPIPNSSASDLNFILGHNCNKFKPGLERVASDTVLYLKDAIHELEDSMRRGLKSSKNIPALHQNSSSESENSPDGGLVLKPELLKSLEATMSGQNNLAWPSPTHTSSTSSLQSSSSCHVVSDETEDVDGIRISRKGSQDPDLSSDAEYENLEHKEFVERWLQKETAFNNTSKPKVPLLESVEEIGEFTLSSVKRKPCLTSTTSDKLDHASNFKSPVTKLSSNVENYPTLEATTETIEDQNAVDDVEDNDVTLDPEATEFNGDFYTLCSIGSLKSLDRFSPARTIDLKQLQIESPVFIKKSPPTCFPIKNDKSKPTGLVKPTRPISLPVSSVPNVPKHLNSALNTRICVKPKSPEKKASRVPRTTTEEKSQVAKLNNVSKVPASSNFSVFQNCGNEKVKQGNFKSIEKTPTSSSSSPSKNSPLSSLPTISAKAGEPFLGVKSKSPTKIMLKNSDSPSKNDEFLRRQQWRRERLRQNRLKEGCGTAWIHLQPNSELSNPTVRVNLLDSMKAPTSSSGSSTEDDDEDVLIIHTNTHLHKICRERRNRVKASANNPMYDLKKRSSIMGRRELFYRFGDKEREAIACFDFLEQIPSSSLETLTKRVETTFDEMHPVPTTHPSELSLPNHGISSNKERISFLSPTFGDASKMAATSDHSTKTAEFAKSPFASYSARRLRLPNLWNKPLSHNMSSSTLNSQDCELLDHISLSDSCAESYSSSTPDSYDDVS